MIHWRKSSRSGGSNSDLACVEVAALSPGVVGLRDSKNPDGPHLSFSSSAFGRLVDRINRS